MPSAIKMIEQVLAAPEGKRDVLMEQTNKELGNHFSLPQHSADLSELAFSIINLAWADAMTDNVIDKVIETKTVDFAGVDYIDEGTMRGMRAYWQGRGGRILSSVLRYTGRQQMPRDEMVAALDIHQDEVTTNFWGTLQKLQAQYEEKLRQLPTSRLIALIAEALPAGSTVDGLAVSATHAKSTITEADIDAVLNTVRRFSKGAQVSILGSESALSVFGRLGATYLDLAEKIFTQGTGFIGQYKGTPLVTISNFEDFMGDLVLPEDELWIVGRNAGRLTFYGAQAKAQVLNLEAFYKRWETARDAGMLLYGAEAGRIGRIILT